MKAQLRGARSAQDAAEMLGKQEVEVVKRELMSCEEQIADLNVIVRNGKEFMENEKSRQTMDLNKLKRELLDAEATLAATA